MDNTTMKYSPRAKQILKAAEAIAAAMGSEQVAAEDLLAACQRIVGVIESNKRDNGNGNGK